MTRVIICDDHALIRRGIRDTLSDAEDIEVVGLAKNGAEALEKAAALKPDIVLMDVHMPVMDGLAVLKFIREKKLTPRLIMLTGDGDPRMISECAKYGATDYLTKPYNYHELIEAIDRALS